VATKEEIDYERTVQNRIKEQRQSWTPKLFKKNNSPENFATNKNVRNVEAIRSLEGDDK
jgi:hypothetical protein